MHYTTDLISFHVHFENTNEVKKYLDLRHDRGLITIDISSSFGAMKIPTEEYYPLMDLVTSGISCQRYSDNTICDCSSDM
jgi:hypothetical protein